ncbi:MAG TPA: hypothetical protein VF936_17950, partial [Burkholderiales bacterium]
RLAPQLLAFAGGDVNFANLVNGLALGLPVTLTTPVGPGVMQIVNFTPIGTMSALQIAQTLETARQALISRGIATPTAQQIGATLIGGLLPTALGNVQVTGLVRANGTLGASIVTQPSAAATLQAGSAAAGGTTVRNTSDSPFGRGISDTPQTLVPGVTIGPTAPMTTGTAPLTPAPFGAAGTTTATPTARPAPFSAR